MPNCRCHRQRHAAPRGESDCTCRDTDQSDHPGLNEFARLLLRQIPPTQAPSGARASRLAISCNNSAHRLSDRREDAAPSCLTVVRVVRDARDRSSRSWRLLATSRTSWSSTIDDRFAVCASRGRTANRNDTSIRKRILRRRAAAKAVELPTAYPVPPLRRLGHPAPTRIGTSASEGSPIMRMKMQYLCLTKGIGSILDASLAPPGEARFGEPLGRPWNGVVDTQA